jgi:hypothetical protein
MLTREQLAEKLRGANVEQLSKLSGVPIRTIYRLRNLEVNAAYDTVADVVRALDAQELNAQSSPELSP